jgi:hypothetical protein
VPLVFEDKALAEEAVHAVEKVVGQHDDHPGIEVAGSGVGYKKQEA